MLGRHFDRVAASIVGTIDQDASRATAGPHFAKRDFLRPHGPSKRGDAYKRPHGTLQ
jgi:hypothetical protein